MLRYFLDFNRRDSVDRWGMQQTQKRYASAYIRCQDLLVNLVPDIRTNYGVHVVPVNLQTRPSPAANPEMIPPLATRSITYSQFQATRWPLSTMYFSPAPIFRCRQQFGVSVNHDNTHVFPDDSTQTREPQNASSTDLICEPTLSREHHLAQILRLILFHHTLRTRQKSVLTQSPRLVAR